MDFFFPGSIFFLKHERVITRKKMRFYFSVMEARKELMGSFISQRPAPEATGGNKGP